MKRRNFFKAALAFMAARWAAKAAVTGISRPRYFLGCDPATGRDSAATILLTTDGKAISTGTHKHKFTLKMVENFHKWEEKHTEIGDSVDRALWMGQVEIVNRQSSIANRQ